MKIGTVFPADTRRLDQGKPGGRDALRPERSRCRASRGLRLHLHLHLHPHPRL